MIRLPGNGTLSDPQRRALMLLVDCARLIPTTATVAPTIDLTDRPASYESLRSWKAAEYGIAPGDGTIHVARAALRVVTDVVNGSRERASSVRDRFGRVPASENALVAETLERDPIVSQAATALRTAALAASGRGPIHLAAPWPDGRRWAVALTHDLDVVAWWPLFTALRLAELARKGAVRRALRTVGEAIATLGRSPIQPGIRSLLEAERRRSIRSTWFVLCGTPTWRTFVAGDLTYHPEHERTRRVLDDLLRDGHSLGLHGSFATLASPEVFTEQRRRLSALTGREIAGVRQHFLRFEPERTPPAMRAAGFDYDSTWGFADRNGFRLGLCDVLPAWENLVEVPFTWMDRALSKYRNVEEPDVWVLDALELARACREVEGLWVGVWHPNLLPALGFPDAPQAYARLLDGLLAEQPYVATLEELVAWRKARSQLRVAGITPDGRPHLESPSPVPLESPAR
jgi:hypothetical protein